MNTLSKYDIADIVSHISGKTQPPAEQPSSEVSFADLLREAVKNIPSSNAAGKVAESGKGVPELTASDVDVVKKNGSEQELHVLLRQAFERAQGGNDIFTSQRLEPQRDQNPSASVIDNLKAALKFGIKEDAEISSKKEGINGQEFQTKMVNSPAGENDILDEKIRVATLMQKRPVILGPGSYDENPTSEVMTNLPTPPPRPVEELPNSDSRRIKSVAVKLEQAIKSDGIEELRFQDSRQENFVNNAYERSSIDPNSISRKPVTDQHEHEGSNASNLIRANELRGDKEVDTDMLMHPETRASLEVAGRAPSHQTSESETVFKSINSQQSDKNISAKLINVDERKIEETKISTTSNLEVSRSRENVLAGETKVKPKLNTPKDVSKDRPSRVERVEAQDNGKQPSNAARLAVETESSEFEGHHRVYDMTRDELPSNKGLQDEANSGGIFTQIAGSSNPVVSDKKRKLTQNEFGKVASAAENNGLVEKIASKNHLKTEFEIRVNEPNKNSEIDHPKSAVVDPKLTIKEGEPTISNQRGEGSEIFKSEPLVNLQSERFSSANRSEVLPRPVSVSNFSSEMQETIYGQLSKSVGGVSKFTVALFPENMGKISVEISYSEAAGLKINMIGDNLEATKVLEQNLSTLRESLQTDKLNELIVNLNSNKDSHGSNQKQAQSDGNNFASNEDKDTGTSKLIDSESDVRNNDSAIDSENGLDTYV
ncbi:MAG: flagellar hook-length control protein FliK [Pseudohongiellaceae bacterium]